jgi:hydrogenase maturation protease
MSDAARPRILVAGIGNVLRGDDGFGPAVVQALLARGALPSGVHAVEIGIGGVGLVHELMDGYDAVVIVDAVDRGGAPGAVYVLEPEVPQIERIAAAERQALGDVHEAVPARALVLARAAGVLPPVVRVIGCQPAETDELSLCLSAPVEPAVAIVVDHVLAFVANLRGASGSDEIRRGTSGTDQNQPGASTTDELRRRDEVLQVLFWLQGQGFGPEMATGDVLRFLDDEAAARIALGQLVEDGFVEAVADGSAARYRLTSAGEQEGRRRFLDEFEPYLARHAHGECGAADCDCHRGASECRGAA